MVVELQSVDETVDEYEMAPEEWRDRLLRKLYASMPMNRKRVAWYLGRQPVPDVPAKYKAKYTLLLDMSRNAWSRLIVDAIAERVSLTGVRLKGDDSDLEIWRLLKKNHIDVDQRLVHSEALTLSTSYYSVWTDGDGGVSIVPESAFQVAHESDPEDRRRTLAAVKSWRDDISKMVYCNLYLPDRIIKWEAKYPDSWDVVDPAETPVLATLISDMEWTEVDEIENLYEIVPIIPFDNRPTLFAGAQSEIDDLIPVLSRIDKFTLDLLVTSEAASFAQKWATGMKVPVDPETKLPVEPFDSSVSKLWVSGSKDTRFGQFSASSLDPYLTSIDAAVAQLSAVSRVPSYYLVSPNLVNPPSAETMIAAEAGLIHKSKSLMGVWGESYEILVRLALRIMNDDRADEPDLQMVWGNPAMPSEAQLADAATKWSTLGVPNEVLWEKGGATPEEIVRWKTIAAREALTAAVLAPVTTVGEAEAIGTSVPQTGSEQAQNEEEAEDLEEA